MEEGCPSEDHGELTGITRSQQTTLLQIFCESMCNSKDIYISIEEAEDISYLMEEGGSCEDHGELTGVVGVVEPALMVEVPGVVTSRKTNNPVPGLAPNPTGRENIIGVRNSRLGLDIA